MDIVVNLFLIYTIDALSMAFHKSHVHNVLYCIVFFHFNDTKSRMYTGLRTALLYPWLNLNTTYGVCFFFITTGCCCCCPPPLLLLSVFVLAEECPLWPFSRLGWGVCPSQQPDAINTDIVNNNRYEIMQYVQYFQISVDNP